MNISPPFILLQLTLSVDLSSLMVVSNGCALHSVMLKVYGVMLYSPSFPSALYSNQQLAAAAAAAAQAPNQSMQQLATIQQLHSSTLYKQALTNNKSFHILQQQQQQQQARLLRQPTTSTTTSPMNHSNLGASGGVVNYQQVDSGIGGSIPHMQLIGANHGLPSSNQQRPNMPVLRTAAPIASGGAAVAVNGPDPHRTMPTLHRTKKSLPTSHTPYNQNKSSVPNPASDRPHLPSQQVT